MKTSQAGVDLIKSFEGLRRAAYLPTPQDVPTIGYGHTGADVRLGDRITEAEAEALLRRDLVEAEATVNRVVTRQIKQHQFDALVSLVFNIGSGDFRSSTLLRLLNAGDFKGAGEQFLRWDKQKGKALAGLTRRRASEKTMFDGVAR